MIRSLIELAKNKSSAKNLWFAAFLCGLFILIFHFLLEPAIVRSTNGFGMLDMLGFQGLALYKEAIASYTHETHLIYMLATALDMIFPLVYGFLLHGIIALSSNQRLFLLPVFLCIALDYFENLGILFLLNIQFLENTILTEILYFTTSSKFVAVAACICIAAGLIIKKKMKH